MEALSRHNSGTVLAGLSRTGTALVRYPSMTRPTLSRTGAHAPRVRRGGAFCASIMAAVC
jgi:hypothetical protein